MIYVTLKDGSRRVLDQAKSVSLVWDSDEGEKKYTLDDVAKLVMIEPELKVRPGNISGMPVVGLALFDLSDIAVETPMPVDFADELAKELPRVAQEARETASRIAEARQRGEITTAQSMADVYRTFGAPEGKPGPNGET